MSGALLVAGTGSDVGKTMLVAGLCRWLARRGVKVAPFKAQNMALNSAVTADGAEIGRAQALQAAAAGIEPEAAMNPVLLKPGGRNRTQVILLGRAVGDDDAQSYQQRKRDLLDVVTAALADLRSRYDVVVCEGAGSPAEINLRRGDIANMGLARAAGLPTIVVGDIDRGGVFAALYGTTALLSPGDQALVAGYLINKFRGDATLLAPGVAQLQALTGRPVLGVLPWLDGAGLDAEDSLALTARAAPEATPPLGTDTLDVAVVRLPRISNFTDVDALAHEQGVRVRFTTSAAEVAAADLALVPGTKATVDDLAFVRAQGIDVALAARAREGAPVLAVCGGYQMLGRTITDGVESGAGRVDGLGLLPVDTVFEPDKLVRRVRGRSPRYGSDAGGYEIRHGRVLVDEQADALLVHDSGEPEGCVRGAVVGTSWHGLLENDDFRRALLADVANRRGRGFIPASTSFAAIRETRLDRFADLVAAHADIAAIERLLAAGAPPNLPVLPPALPESR